MAALDGLVELEDRGDGVEEALASWNEAAVDVRPVVVEDTNTRHEAQEGDVGHAHRGTDDDDGTDHSGKSPETAVVLAGDDGGEGEHTQGEEAACHVAAAVRPCTSYEARPCADPSCRGLADVSSELEDLHQQFQGRFQQRTKAPFRQPCASCPPPW